MRQTRRGRGPIRIPTYVIAALLVGLLALAALLPLANQQLIAQVGLGQAMAPDLLAGYTLFVGGGSPYDPADLAESLPAMPDQMADPDDATAAQPYDRPIWGLAVFALLAVTSPDWALAFWLSLVQISLPLTVWAALRLADWRPTPRVTGALLLVSYLWYYGAQAIVAGTAGVLAIGLLIGGLALARAGLDLPAGLLVALSTLEPLVGILGLLLLLIWGVAGRRWLLVLSSWLGLGLLVLLGWTWLPGWPLGWLTAVVGQGAGGRAGPIALTSFDGPVSLLVAALLGITLLWQLAVSVGKGPRWFGWAAALTLAVGFVLLAPPEAASVHLLLPGLFLSVGVWLDRWGRRGAWLAAALGATLLIGPWLAYVLRAPTVTGAPPGLLWLLWLIVFPALWWVRWWAVQPARLPEAGWTQG